jgi:LPS-assembly protein
MLSSHALGYNRAILQRLLTYAKQQDLRKIGPSVKRLLSVTLLGAFIYLSALSMAATADSATRLGWIEDKQQICHGYFYQPALPSITARNIHSSQVIYSPQGVSTLQNIVVEETDKRLQANSAYFTTDPHTGEIVVIHASGDVRLYTPGKFFTSDAIEVNLTANTAYTGDAAYYLILENDTSAHGTARQLQQLNADEFVLHEATYSTCAPTQLSWQLQSEKIHIDQATGIGQAYHTTLYWHQIPVFYTPYLQYLLDDRRKSGWLTPQIGTSSHNNFYFALPYYFNLAPNLDLTVTPYVYSRRGILIANDLRYLSPLGSGQIHYSVLPDDQDFDRFKQSAANEYPSRADSTTQNLLASKNTRQFFSWQHQSQPHEQLKLNFDYNLVTDDYYFQDFPQFTYPGGGHNQLPRQAQAIFNTEHWQLNALVQAHQTLHPINEPEVLDIYSRLPELTAHAHYEDTHLNLFSELDMQLVNFNHPNLTLPDPYNPQRNQVNGQRYALQPSLEWRIGDADNAHVTPKVQLQHLQLHTEQNSSWPQRFISRTTPIFSVDSALHFTQATPWFDQSLTHTTLTPRLYYLYVPFRDQNDTPVFDSYFKHFTFEENFADNRFTSYDRIGDANQLGVGLSAEFFQDTQTVARLGIGQTYYFKDRQVSLCSTPQCIATENVNFQQRVSPLTAQAKFSLAPQLSAQGDIAWDIPHKVIDNAQASLIYQPGDNYYLYANYTYIDNTEVIRGNRLINGHSAYLKLGSAVGINDNATLFGIFAQDTLANFSNAQSYHLGVQYDTCCWAVRVFGGRRHLGYNAINQAEYDNVLYVQLTLNSLGSIGDHSPSRLIEEFLPGYTDIFTH